MNVGKKVKQSEALDSVDITNEKDFAKLIKYKRTSLGFSIVKASSLCGVSDKTLQKLENGSEGVRLSTALKVAKMLGIKINFEA